MPRSAAQIQTTLTAYYAAQTALATAASYTMDTGQSRVTVTRADLASINATIRDLEAQLEDADGSDAGISFERGSV